MEDQQHNSQFGLTDIKTFLEYFHFIKYNIISCNSIISYKYVGLIMISFIFDNETTLFNELVFLTIDRLNDCIFKSLDIMLIN